MINRELTDYLLINACNAAVVAGADIMKIYNAHTEFDVNIKSDNTLVTEADRVSHEKIKKYLSQTRVPMLSEEGRNMLFEERYRWDLYWLVDPIDGTREFVNKNDEFVVCIALMTDNKPLFGVIYVPAEDKLYFSDPDRGAFLVEHAAEKRGDAFQINTLYSLAIRLEPHSWDGSRPLRVVVTRSHMTHETEEFIDDLRKKFGPVEEMHCGSSKKFCYLAEGKADVYIRLTSVFDWDIAAGHAIANAVDATVKHIGAGDIAYNKRTLVIDPFIAYVKGIEL